ncbi:universal stress protein [Natronomonas halophila]|uniref:universal stress protein n=1 Tax=Natronomonas halophila TaxID=2747817 RepID=UPI0015B6CAAD|nr:universal stress protein [Natronomonas halophila]QLD85985.1 universal stress protein [Natronomonas halophila]
MTFMVPFDGKELAEAALVRAKEFNTVLDERIVAVSVIPKENVEYARERGWLQKDEPFDVKRIVAKLHEQVLELAPEANFRHIVVSRYAPTGTIASQLRRHAEQEDASMVFIGSENAGRVVSTVSSVGNNVASDEDYDVVIIRNRTPSKIAKIRNNSPHRRQKSDFYFPR